MLNHTPCARFSISPRRVLHGSLPRVSSQNEYILFQAQVMAISDEMHPAFKIPEIKFLLISAAARMNRAPVRKKPKDSLGITAGQPLPRNGRCTHYNKSYRWFRFSCCQKVFACDKCHDTESDHPNEHANRMICGYCSREQNYRPEVRTFRSPPFVL